MDDTYDARRALRDPQTQKTLRQFLTLESGNYVSNAMRRNYDVAVHGSAPLVKPAHCDACDFIAATIAEVAWHEERNPGHECCPDNAP